MKIFFALTVGICVDVVLAGVFRATVSGRTTCNGQAMPFATVELLDHDVVTTDDVLDTRVSDDLGVFMLTGTENEAFTIEPYVRITHTCNAKPNCKRISKFVVPKDTIDLYYELNDVRLESADNFVSENC